MKDIPAILILGFLGFAVYHTCLSIGEQSVDAGTASLVVSLTPLFSALIAMLVLKETLNRYGWIGSFIAFLGVMVITLGESGGIHFK